MNGCENQNTMPEPRHTILDVVELVADSGRWPAGTVGTVVEADAEQALVEISDDRGHALDFVSVPHRALGSRPSRSEDRVAS
jgi:hypothetical protein